MIKKWFKKLTGEAGSETQEATPPQSEALEESADSPEVELPRAAVPPPEAPAAPSEPPPATAPEKPRAGLFKRLKAQMAKSRGGFVRQMDELLMGRKEISPEILDDLEEILVTADMGVSTVQALFEKLRGEVKRKELTEPEALRRRLKTLLLELLQGGQAPIGWAPEPFVVLVVGVNGVGKTTTIAKLAHYLGQQGKKVLLVAGDTFRAAAAEQLETWGERLGVPVIRHQAGADPSAVAFDGLEAALKRRADVVIVDTAGRLHTKVNLMEELKKIQRVMRKKIPDAPHEVLLVLDATTGQNAVSQAKLFHEAAGVTGMVLTKLDGTAKGGIVVSITHEMGIPIRFIGIGEGMEDLRPFEPKDFVDALFD